MACQGNGNVKFALIADAPTKAGIRFGPCIVADEDGDWTIGRWDGIGWFDPEGYQVKPSVWAELPLVSELLNFLAANAL